MSKRTAWSTQDLLLLMMIMLTAVVFVLLAAVNPKAAADKTADSTPPGVVSVEAIWPPNLDADIDLWVKAPGDIPVGYSNKGGAIFNLLRDDLGSSLDLSGLNYENAYSRGIFAGKYVVNLHFYRNRSKTATIPVKVIVSVKSTVNDEMKKILLSDVNLDAEGREVTVFRFDLDDKGQLVPGSVDQLDTPLRNMSGKK